jgi:hypothetical protein
MTSVSPARPLIIPLTLVSAAKAAIEDSKNNAIRLNTTGCPFPFIAVSSFDETEN